MVLHRSKKTLLIVAIVIVISVSFILYFFVFSNNSDTNNGPDESADTIEQTNSVVIDDIEVSSIESIKKDFSNDPTLIYSQLSHAGSQKVYVGKDADAIPYFQAAYEFAQNDEQRIGTEIRIYNSAKNSGNTSLAEEYKSKLGDNLTNPTVTGQSQNVD